MTNKPSDLEQRISERRDPISTGTSESPAAAADFISEPPAQAGGRLRASTPGELNHLIASDPAAAKLDREYQRLANVLSGWRTLPAGVNFRSFRASVADAVTADVEYRVVQAHDAGTTPDVAGITADAASRLSREYKKTDDAIRTVASRTMPAVDWNTLKSRISAAVRTEAAESDPHHERTILLPTGAAAGAGASRQTRRAADASKQFIWKKFALPLSAAAAIAIVATTWFNRGAPVGPMPSPINMNRIVVQLAAPQHAGMVNIAFDESPMPAALAVEPSTRGAAIAIGPGHDFNATLPDDAFWQ